MITPCRGDACVARFSHCDYPRQTIQRQYRTAKKPGNPKTGDVNIERHNRATHASPWFVRRAGFCPRRESPGEFHPTSTPGNVTTGRRMRRPYGTPGGLEPGPHPFFDFVGATHASPWFVRRPGFCPRRESPGEFHPISTPGNVTTGRRMRRPYGTGGLEPGPHPFLIS